MTPRAYPNVLSEADTLRFVCDGRSIARYGDGEFRLCTGLSAKAQRHDRGLQIRLRAILHDAGDCFVGIPNLQSATPKAPFWKPYVVSAVGLLADLCYASSFITRPDSAPWIDTPEYWAALESLWMGQDVTLVRGSGSSFTADRLSEAGAGVVTEILAPREHAFSEYDALLDRIGTPRRALLCLGPTATVLAVDLCARGVHAIDIGHCGLFYQKHLAGEPMIRTEADKTAWMTA